MPRPGEIITLQFGSYANWTGAHFWNFQARLLPAACDAWMCFPIPPPPRDVPGADDDPSSPPCPPSPSSDQDETLGLAEGFDPHAHAYAELDSGVLYRVGETLSVRVARPSGAHPASRASAGSPIISRNPPPPLASDLPSHPIRLAGHADVHSTTRPLRPVRLHGRRSTRGIPLRRPRETGIGIGPPPDLNLGRFLARRRAGTRRRRANSSEP